MLQSNELKDFQKYVEDLKSEVIRSKTKIVPFRFFFDFPFEDKARDVLLVGKAPPSLLSDVKKLAGSIKLEGDCQVSDNQLRLKVDNGLVTVERVQKLLKAAMIKFPAKFVEDFEGGAQASRNDFDMKAAAQRVASIEQRIKSVFAYMSDKKQLSPVLSLLKEVKDRIKDGDATSGARADELLDRAEQAFIPVERSAQIARKTAGQAPSADAKFGNIQVETKREVEAIAQAKAVSERAEEQSQTALNAILQARDTALKWQNLEMDKMLANKDQFRQLLIKFNEDESKIKTSIKTAKAEVEEAKVTNDTLDLLIRTGTLGTNETKRKTAEYMEMKHKKIPKAEEAIEKLERFLRKLRQDFSEARAKVSAGDKHGTGRHGTHTGLEQQALRAATGGTSSDQADNEWGDSRDKPEPKRSTTPARSADKVLWTMGGEEVELEYEDLPDGTRMVKNEEKILETFNKIAIRMEDRGASTPTSSNFLSPELEKEAVDRALKVAQQCIWDEEWDDKKNDWVPIDRFLVYVGPPKTVRSKGWGHSVSRNKDDKGDSASKIKLVEANKVLNAFRNGKIDLDRLMKLMNVSLEKSDDGGAILQPVARVMIDRSGSGWTNTSQYPTTDKPGWSLKGKKVRKRRDRGDGVTAPEATGV